MTRRLALATLCVALVAGTGPVGAEHHEGGTHAEGDVPVIQVVSTLVGGKNVYIPSTLVVRAGQPVRLSIYNTTDIPHGFAIPDLGIEAVLVEQQETLVDVPALKAPAVHGIHCQLHPAHRTATLAVIE